LEYVDGYIHDIFIYIGDNPAMNHDM